MNDPHDPEALIAAALAQGATHAGLIDVSHIRFYPAVRRMCESNRCGVFGKNWMCPPHVGELADLAAQVRQYRHGIVFQTVCSLEDSYDVEGMNRGQADHRIVVRKVTRNVVGGLGLSPHLILGAGPCDICPTCTILVGEPCRYPERAVGSLEACGMNVKEVVESAGLAYLYGPNTVAFAGMVLFDPV